MKHLLSILTLSTAIFLVGCAEDLSPEVTDRPPAPYSPDAEAKIPQHTDYTSNRM